MSFLFRNWQLKLGAITLATVLYTGLVFSESFSENSLQVPVGTVGHPDGLTDSSEIFVLTPPPNTVEVTYRVANDRPGTVTPDAFRATVDLAGYDIEHMGDPQSLDLAVDAVLEGVEVVGWQPRQVDVALDRVAERDVPIRVDYGEIPDGLSVDDPVITADDAELSEVTATGPESLLERVDHAVARVRLQPSGIDISSDVVLEAVDANGQPVLNIDLSPETVFVQIDVTFVETTTTVAVRPDISGTPAPGFALAALRIEPSVVTLRGLPEDLTEITEVLTEPLSIDGATEDQVFEADLSLPDGTRLADASAAASVTVTATIEPSVSSRTFVSGVICQGAGENACLPGLGQVSVTLSGPGGVLTGLSAGDVTVILNVAGLAPGQHTVNASLPTLPDGVEVESISPGSVPVTIEAPATPTPAPTPTPSPGT